MRRGDFRNLSHKIRPLMEGGIRKKSVKTGLKTVFLSPQTALLVTLLAPTGALIARMCYLHVEENHK